MGVEGTIWERKRRKVSSHLSVDPSASLAPCRFTSNPRIRMSSLLRYRFSLLVASIIPVCDARYVEGDKAEKTMPDSGEEERERERER